MLDHLNEIHFVLHVAHRGLAWTAQLQIFHLLLHNVPPYLLGGVYPKHTGIHVPELASIRHSDKMDRVRSKSLSSHGSIVTDLLNNLQNILQTCFGMPASFVEIKQKTNGRMNERLCSCTLCTMTNCDHKSTGRRIPKQSSLLEGDCQLHE